jgi:DNA-binding CsgD family transcriptional regulator
LISQGQTTADAATALGIGKSTARWHLLRVFEKTGCKRQAELVALAGRLSLSI